MSVTLYDKALQNKVISWIRDPNLVVLSVDETTRLFEWRADVTSDKPLQLPMVAISRDRDIDILNTVKRFMSYRGKVFESENGKSAHLNAIPIKLKYQLDIYTREAEEAYEYLRNFIFFIVNHPKLTVQIPYSKSNLEQDSFMELISPATDNSDIPERLIAGQFTRLSLRIELRDAYLFSYRFKDVVTIDASDISVKFKEEN